MSHDAPALPAAARTVRRAALVAAGCAVLGAMVMAGWAASRANVSDVAAHVGQASRESPAEGPTLRGDQIVVTDAALSVELGRPLTPSVPVYEKFESDFLVIGSVATNPDFPYDPDEVPGLPTRVGISAEGLFLPPDERDWSRAIVQPAFRYQPFERVVREDAEGLSPTGPVGWRVRFAPTRPGDWQYRLRVQDASICGEAERPCRRWVESAVGRFTAEPARPGQHGFVRVSRTDPRYFEYSDGTPFIGLGHQTSFGSTTSVEDDFDRYEQNGVTLLRTWMSATGVFGVGFWFWDPWTNSTLVFDPVFGGHDVAARIEGVGDSPCIFTGFAEGPRPVFRGGRTYRLRLRARLEGIEGPRVGGNPYGLVAKLGTWPKDVCGQPGNQLRTLSDYWSTTNGEWTELTSTFELDEDVIVGWGRYFTVALENTDAGFAYIDEIRVEDTNGVNVLSRGRMNHHLGFDQAASWRWDRILDLAADRGITFKLVILEKEDVIFGRIRPDGSIAAEPVGLNFHGVDLEHPDRPTRVRRLQEYFWRYLSARWGYSTAVHSWELLNEGNPFDGHHYDQAEAFGRAIRATDPNHHLVTTSFWHSFPAGPFWANPAYASVDYADLHAYITTTGLEAPGDIADPLVRAHCQADRDCYLEAMRRDSALFHLEHSAYVAREPVGKPIVRGETGLTVPGTDNEPDPRLMDDEDGVWLHKLLFAQLAPGALQEIYWFTDAITENDLYPIFRRYRDFVATVPLTSGGYGPIDVHVAGDELRVVGQMDRAAQQAVVWLDNRRHTWANVVEGQSIAPAGGLVTLSGFTPGASLTIEWWNTCSGEAPDDCRVGVERRETLVADPAGRLTLHVMDVGTDTAAKIGFAPSAGGA